MNNRICALIPARYNSSRLPGKPLLIIDGLSIIKRTYLQTRKSKLIKKIFVLTDDEKIQAEIIEIGGEVLMMKEDCLNGTERICKCLKFINNNYDVIVNVQGDEPFIDPNHIDYAIEKYLENERDENMVCTTIHYHILDEKELYNRSIGKMIVDKFNNILYCSRSLIPHTKSGSHDKSTKYYGHIGLFIFRRNYLMIYMEENTNAQLAEDIEWLKILEQGYKIKSFEVKNYEIGINTMEDYKYLIEKYQNSKKF